MTVRRLNSVSGEHRRVEDVRFITGKGRYTDDLSFDGMLHGIFVRNALAHGRIVYLDVSAARAAPGVVAVFASADLGHMKIASPFPDSEPERVMARPVLAANRVRFAGEAIAFVVAESAAEAADAADAVAVDIDPLPPVIGFAAIEDNTLVFPEAGSNVVVARHVGDEWEDDPGQLHVTVDVPSPRIDPMVMEPFAAVAVAEPDGSLTLWCGTQTPHRARDGAAAALGIRPEQLRVRVPDVGGGFGQRGGFRPEYVAVAAATQRLGRPVKWLATRREMLTVGGHGRAHCHHVELRADESGRIGACRIEVLSDLGAYPHRGFFIPMTIAQLSSGPYAIPRMSVSLTAVVTNTAPVGPYCGAGRPEAALAIERAIDALADATSLDPIEIRRRNFVHPDAMPHTTVTGLPHDGGDYGANLDLLLAAHEGRSPGPIERGAHRRGFGFAAFVEPTGGRFDAGETARVRLESDRATVLTGATTSGQGHETAWARLAADVFTLRPEDVVVKYGDTADLPSSNGSFGSRSAPIGASAVWRAAGRVRDEARRLAARMLEAAETDLVLRDGLFTVVGVPGASVSVKDVARRAEEDGSPLVASDHFVTEGFALS